MKSEVVARRRWQWSFVAGIIAVCIVGCGLVPAQTMRADRQTRRDAVEVAADVEPAEGYGISREYLRFRLFDPAGRLVAGAMAGPTPQMQQDMLGGIVRWRAAGTSNEQGELVLAVRYVLAGNPGQSHGAVYILHDDRGLGALYPVNMTDGGRTFNIRLSPVCRVHGTLVCPQFEAAGMPLWGTTVEVQWRETRILGSSSRSNSFEFLLPPGRYALAFNGLAGRIDADAASPSVPAWAGQEVRSLRIADGLRDLDLGVIELSSTEPQAIEIQPSGRALTPVIQKASLPPAVRKTHLNEVYRLEATEVLKRIAPPFIPERRYCTIENVPVDFDAPDQPEYLGFRWDTAHKTTDSIFGVSPRLGSLLENVIGLKLGGYSGPRKLLDLELPGDWIVRDDAPREAKLRALEQLIVEETKRRIRFEKRTAVRDEIVAIGRFKFRPVYETARICVFSGDSWVTDDAGVSRLGRVDSTGEFLQALATLLHTPILDDTETLPRTSIPFCADVDRVLRSEPGEEWEWNVKSLLENVSAQTSLQFRLEKQPAEVWFVAEGTRN